MLPGAWGKVRRTGVKSFPRYTLYLCCRQKGFHIHIFAPGQSSQWSHSNGIITGMYAVIKNWTTVCNWCQRLPIQNHRWKGLLVKPDLALIWTSALNKQLLQPPALSEIRGYCCSCFQSYACILTLVTTDMLGSPLDLADYLPVPSIFCSISWQLHC